MIDLAYQIWILNGELWQVTRSEFFYNPSVNYAMRNYCADCAYSPDNEEIDYSRKIEVLYIKAITIVYKGKKYSLKDT